MADGIPYPQAPQYNVANPLQQAEQMQSLGLRGAEMQRVQQGIEQQELVNQSKRVIGELAQQAIDPATNEVDMHKLLLTAASHPGARLGYLDLAEKSLNMGILDAQRHNAELDRQAKEFDFTAKAMSGLADDPDVMNNTKAANGKIGAAFAQIGTAADKPRGWATERFLQFQQLKMKPSSFVQQALMGTQSGREALSNARENFNKMTEPVQVMEYDPNTGERVPVNIPRAEWLRRQAGQGNLVGIGSAPPGTARQQGESPSAPPATMPGEVPYSERSIATGLPAGEAEIIKGRSDDWNNLRKNVYENAEAATASSMALEDMEGKLKSMGYRTGLFSPEQLQLAKAALFFDPKDQSGLLSTIVDAKSPEDAAKIIGTMEAFDKQSIIDRTKNLRDSLGAAQRITNAEFKTFQDALVSLRTSPQGIQEIYKYLKKLNNLAQERANFLQDYTEELGHTPHRNDVVRFEKEWLNHVKSYPQLYKYEGPSAEGEK